MLSINLQTQSGTSIVSLTYMQLLPSQWRLEMVEQFDLSYHDVDFILEIIDILKMKLVPSWKPSIRQESISGES